MRINNLRTITGPNIYSHRPVLIMTLNLEALTGRESREFPGFNKRLLVLLQGIKKHPCNRGWSKTFVE
ncbi:MAG TPA: hypothetical protein VEF04_17415, partial [Blastocatellia bacterium]|nr:hypothetical protein [Blastocatellia bacterium]